MDDRQSEHDESLFFNCPANLPVVRIRNKIDLTGNKSALKQDDKGVEISLSVKTGDGIDLLLRHLKSCAGYDIMVENVFVARRRHLDALSRAHQSVERGLHQLHTVCASELLAEDLRLAQFALSEITGAFSNEELLDRVFSSFCIGK